MPEAQALAEALGVDSIEQLDQPFDFARKSLRDLGDLDGDGIHEMALVWPHAEGVDTKLQPKESPRFQWTIFLLSWDGKRWVISRLLDGREAIDFEFHALSDQSLRAFAVTIYVGAAQVPYPAVFRFERHSASLLWDSRSKESRYQGYEHGQVEFQPSKGELPEMVVSGRADPGLVVYPPASRRGFDAHTTYKWEENAYMPAGTEYSLNEDLTIYRFIAALHVHDFRTAYSLVDPARFLKTAKPSLQLFREQIQNSWPEFLDDRIFQARDPGRSASDDFSFELEEEGRHYIYHPSFTQDDQHLLTELQREEEGTRGR